MSDAELRTELLKIIEAESDHGHQPLASELLEKAHQKWNADEFEVREAIWHLLSTNQVVLTPERTLRLAKEEEAPV